MHIPQLQHGTILRVYFESCLDLPAKRIRPPAEPMQKVASPVPAQSSLDSHFGHPERRDDTAASQYLTSPLLWVLRV